MEETHAHDLRALSTIRKRARNQAEKYWSFRNVHPGQVGAPHYRLLDDKGRYPFPSAGLQFSQATLTNLTPIETFTPQRLYQEAQCWPRPPKYHHRHTDKLDKRGATNSYETRRNKKRELRRAMKRIVGSAEWRETEEGMRHSNSARRCEWCALEKMLEDEKEAEYEEAAWRENQQVDEIIEPGQQSSTQGSEVAPVTRSGTDGIQELEEDEWSIVDCPDQDVNIEEGSGDSESDWEILDY